MKLVYLFTLIITLSGCTSMGKKLKAFLGGKKPDAVAATAPKSNQVKYSDNPNVQAGVRRHYRRVTKQALEDEAALQPNSGSLWIMEGQGAYLFSQNIVRMIGDPVAVTLEGDPKEQLQAKVDVIKKLWTKFEERQAKMRELASEDKNKEAAKEGKDAKPAEKTDKEKADAEKTAANDKPDFNVKNVPTRIVERTVDGNYRVKGTQPFMIGSREYKVIVTGIVRAEDFNEEGIPASKLLDSKFDVVSAKRKEEI